MENSSEKLLQEKISSVLKENIEKIEYFTQDNVDVAKREFTVQDGMPLDGVLFYIDGLSDTDVIETAIMKPLLYYAEQLEYDQTPLEQTIEQLERKLLLSPSVAIAETIGDAFEKMLCGDAIVFLEHYDQGIIVATRAWEIRGVQEPTVEPVVRGPRDGFIEDIRTNTALIRRRIRDPHLKVEGLNIGKRSKTDVNIVYIEGLVRDGLVEEVRSRLADIDTDSILESGYIEEFIDDAPLSPFTTVQNTERPDKVASSILEGRVAILVDNTPFVLIVPVSFWEFLQASDDYYSHYWMGSFFRLIRYLAFILSFTLPSLYVMLVTFHQEMLPTPLALSVAAGREDVPFPALVEVLMMEVAFELLREAGIRMPKPIGAAVSILGSLVIGQAAVEAGVLAPIMVIVIAATGIGSFAIPNYSASFSIRLLRFPLLLASGLFGLLGFAVVITLITVHGISLRSFGQPYMAPVANFRATEMRDFVLRLPWWAMNKRPFTSINSTRQKEDQKPSKPSN